MITRRIYIRLEESIFYSFSVHEGFRVGRAHGERVIQLFNLKKFYNRNDHFLTKFKHIASIEKH